MEIRVATYPSLYQTPPARRYVEDLISPKSGLRVAPGRIMKNQIAERVRHTPREAAAPNTITITRAV